MKRVSTTYLAASILLITFVAYLSSLKNDFVMLDDGAYVVTNPHIRSFNLAFFRWAFFGFYSGNWHPLTWMSHALDYAVWGLNPLGHHLTSIILHAVNSFIVVLLAMKLLSVGKKATAQAGFSGFMNEQGILVAAGLTGLLFGLHPLHVESVAWVAERKDLLCALFFMLSVMKYTDYAGSLEVTARKNLFLPFFNKHYAFTFGLFALALLSKPMAVTLPVVLLILDWYPFNRIGSRKGFFSILAEKIPFFLLSMLSSIITIVAQQKAMMPTANAPLSTRLLVAVDALISYLGKMIWPLNLVPFYPYPNHVSLFSFKYLSAVLLVVGITIGCIVAAKKQKIWLAAWIYFIVTLLPVIGLVQVGSQSMADRYTYLPSLGPFLMIGLGAALIYAKIFTVDKPSSLAQPVAAAAAIVVLFSLTFLTVAQTGIWKNSITLWTYVVQKEPWKSSIPYNELGMAYEDKGMADQAIEQYKIALRFSPQDADIRVNLGQAYADKGLIDQAIEQYQIALRSDPTHALAHNNLGLSFRKQGLIDKAIEQYQTAVRLEQDNALYHNNLGVAFGENGLQDKALEQYQIALQLDPQNALAHNNLGIVLEEKGFLDQAVGQYVLAVRFSPSDADIRVNLGRAYEESGLIDQAVSQYQIAVILKPTNAMAHNDLGVAFKKQGVIVKAIEEYQTALRLEPNNAQFHNNLGAAYEAKDLEDKAVDQYQIALRLDPKNLLAHINLGDFYSRKGFTNLAIEQYTAALKLRPNSDELHTSLGMAYLKKGSANEAIRQFKLTVALQPGSPRAHSNLGAVYGKFGFTNKAIEQFRIAVKLDPANPNYRRNLDNAYKNQGHRLRTNSVTYP